jgi:SAM-dependent methyltransferase
MTDQIDGRGAPAPALFGLAVFTSAALVFMVQPMLARMILPTLGGSSMVWNTSLAFFQIALLVGYGYAHLLQRLPTLRRQMITHLAVLLLAALVLPLRISGLLGDAATNTPTLWLVGVLTLSVGAPFAALSATAPLIQAWYSRLHGAGPQGRDPYVLYAASNLGSLLALLSYPVLVEPFARLGAQATGWSVGYGVFVLVVIVLILLGWRVRDHGIAATEPEASAIRISWRDRVQWLLLAAAPSSLLLGVSGHITSDVASAPFLWVVPLALYLVTFIIAFQPRRGRFVEIALLMQALLLPGALLLFAVPGADVMIQLPLHLMAFFFTAQVCAFALAQRRPAPVRLTEFYLWLSLGGVLGGAFNAFLAPLIFSGVWEYPIVLILACLARPIVRTRPAPLYLGLFGAALLCAAALVSPLQISQGLKVALMLIPAGCALLLYRHTLLMTGTLAALAVASYLPNAISDEAENYRSFFGVIQLKDRDLPGIGLARVMVHGSTVHGSQRLDPALRCAPTTYYALATPIGQVFSAEQYRRPGMNVGAVGLGVGSVASYVRADDRLRFFEIDPKVVRLAFDPEKFTYVKGCARGPVDVAIGDARFQLERMPPESFDLLLVDAFSSDSVPTHLMTVEAMRLYLRLLKPGGVLALHISNRNLDLGGPAEAAVRAAGGVSMQQLYHSGANAVESSSHVLIAAREQATLAPYVEQGKWRHQPRPARAWTDDYTNAAGAILSRLRD